MKRLILMSLFLLALVLCGAEKAAETAAVATGELVPEIGGVWTKGEPVKLSGDLFYARHSGLGALITSDTFYKGRIRKVRTTLRPDWKSAE